MLRSELSARSQAEQEGRYIESVTQRQMLIRSNPAIVATRAGRDPLTGQSILISGNGQIRAQRLSNADGANGSVIPASVRVGNQGYGDQKPVS